MERLLEAYKDYIISEFQIEEETSIPEDGILPLAYTTYDFDDEREIQVSFDINNLKYLNYIDGELVLEQPVSSLEDFIADLECGDFNGFIADCIDEGYRRYGFPEE